MHHERQRMQLCALHAVNSVMPPAKARFTKAEFDRICLQLSPARWFNPHRAWCGTGYYDVNVIMFALQERGFEVSWFDTRRPVSELPDSASVTGFVLNRAYRGWPWLCLRDKHHWFAVRNVDGAVYNLDSKLRQPEVGHWRRPWCLGLLTPPAAQVLSSEGEFRDLARGVVSRGGHVLVVRPLR